MEREERKYKKRMNPEHKHQIAVLCSVLLILLLMLLSIAVLAVSFISFNTVKSYTDVFTINGSADFLTSLFYAKIQAVLRFVGTLLLIAAAFLLFVRRSVIGLTDRFLNALSVFIQDMKLWFSYTVCANSRMHLLTLATVILLSVVVRVVFLFQPMRYDESFTFMRYASKPLYIALSYYETPNNHMFHTFLVHLVHEIFGVSPWVIRLPVLVSGVLVVCASYAFVLIFYNKYAATLAAGFVACSSALIEFSTNARGYMLICFFCLVLFLLVAYLTCSNNAAVWFFFSIVSAIGFYTIPIMLYPFGIASTWFVLSVLTRDSKQQAYYRIRWLLISVVASLVIAFILYTPSFVVTGFRSVLANQFVSPRPFFDFVALIPSSVISVCKQWSRDIPLFINALLIVGFITSVVFHRRLSSHRVPIVLAVLLFCIPTLMIQRVIPYTRVWLFLLPVVLGMASAGLVYCVNLVIAKFNAKKDCIFNGAALVITVLLCFSILRNGSILQSTDTGTLRDAEEITVFLADYLKPGDGVFTAAPSEAPLEYYFKRHGVSLDYLYADFTNCQRIIVVVNEAFHMTIVERVLKSQTVAELVGKLRSQVTNLGQPHLIKRFELATLYEIPMLDQ